MGIQDSFYIQLLAISKKIGLPVKKILEMLFVLQSGPVKNNQLVRQLGVSQNVLNQVKKELAEFLEPASSMTELKEVAKAKIEPLFNGDFMMEDDLWRFLECEVLKRITSCLERYQDLRSKPKREYDQFMATVETTARRAALMDFLADVQDKKILFLGDNDLTSVAVASLKKAAEIMVLEIDKRVLETIKKIASAEELAIKAHRYDARQKLPKAWQDKFDVVLTDPPYTTAGVKLFLSRAIRALDPNNWAARIYFCYGNSDRAKERFLPIYEVLLQSGLMSRWVFDKFNRYYGAESIGSSSVLFVCEATPKTKALVAGDFQGKIYTVDQLAKNC